MNFLAKLTDLPEGHEYIRSDFEKRYLNTYLVETLNGKQRIVFFIGNDRETWHFRDCITNETTIYRANAEVDMVPFLPQVGYYNIHGKPIYIFKNPQKQWKRSFCNSIYTTDATQMERGRTDNTITWKEYALEMLHPVYAHLDELTKKLYAYVALNRMFALQANEKGQHNLVYRQYVVGCLNFKERTIKVLQPTFLQEIQDLLKHTGVQTWKLQ